LQAACGEPSSNKDNAQTTIPSTAKSPQPAEKPAAESAAPQTPTAQPAPATAEAPKKPKPCAADRKELCAEKRGNDVKPCLVEHKDELSGACKTALKL
jgi:hypothetical protein